MPIRHGYDDPIRVEVTDEGTTVDTTLWIIACALGAAYLTGGVALNVLGRARYRALGSSQHWVDDFGDDQLRVIGGLKVLGAAGVVLPGAVGVVPVLTPLAACGLALFMAGAGTTRFRRREWGLLVGDLVYLGLFAFLAWGRFDLQPF